MTTINAHFSGTQDSLEMLKVSGIKFASSVATRNGKMVASWTCETTDYDTALAQVMDSIDLQQVELWNCDLTYLG